MPEATAWQNRALEKVYPFIFMDAIHYKVKEDYRYVTKAAYVVLGVTMDGRFVYPGCYLQYHWCPAPCRCAVSGQQIGTQLERRNTNQQNDGSVQFMLVTAWVLIYTTSKI